MAQVADCVRGVLCAAQIGQRIRELREARTMSQKELATKLGYKSRTPVVYMELGLQPVTYEQLIQLSEILQVQLWDLIADAPILEEDERLMTSAEQMERAGQDLVGDMRQMAKSYSPAQREEFLRFLGKLAKEMETA